MCEAVLPIQQLMRLILPYALQVDLLLLQSLHGHSPHDGTCLIVVQMGCRNALLYSWMDTAVPSNLCAVGAGSCKCL